MADGVRTQGSRRRKVSLPRDLDSMEDHAAEAAALLRSLANPHRLLVLCSLAGGERSVGELNEAVPLSQSALSQHLARLRQDGLVSTRREGKTIRYCIADEAVYRLIGVLYETFCESESNS